MSGYEYGKGDTGGAYGREMAPEGPGGDYPTSGGMEGLMEKIPGTEAHRARHAGVVAGDPVYGETGRHSTETGAKTESAWHEAKSAMPGTEEYKMTHERGEGVRPYEGVREEADRAAMAHERRHATRAEAGGYGEEESRYGMTGEGRGYGETGEKRSTMEKVMAAIPGTEEHREKKAEQRMAKEEREERERW